MMTGSEKQTWIPDLILFISFQRTIPSEIAINLFPVFNLKNLDDKNRVMD